MPHEERLAPVAWAGAGRHAARDTLTAVELDRGEALVFALRSGREVELALEDTSAEIVERLTPGGVEGMVDMGGVLDTFACRIRVDGQPVTLRRYLCSQECFYEPWVINGLRIWLDIVKEAFDVVPVRYPRL